MIGDEFTGIYTDGKPTSINGCGFPDVQQNEDIRSIFHLGDIADGSMTFWRDEIVPVITETRCPIVISKFHEAEFVFTTEELTMDEFIDRYPYKPSQSHFHNKECRNFEVRVDSARLSV